MAGLDWTLLGGSKVLSNRIRAGIYVVLKRHAWNDYSEILYTMQEPQMPDRDLAVEFPTLKDALDHLNDTYQLFMATVNIWETSVSKPKEYRVPTKLLDNE